MNENGEDMIGSKILSSIRLDLAVVIVIFIIGTVGNYTALAQVPAQNKADILAMKAKAEKDIEVVKSDVADLKEGQVRAETAQEFMRSDIQRVLTILEGRYTEPRGP